MTIKATNHATGEVIELPANSLQEVVQAWKIAQEYDKASASLKDQLKELVPNWISDKGISQEVLGCQFRVSHIQKKNYDKAVLREVIQDEDTLDMLLKPDKPAIDRFLKENLQELGEGSTTLRQRMVDEGKPYQVIKLEKLTRD